MQACARAFGERLVSDRFQSVIAEVTDDSVRCVLSKLHHLYLADVLDGDLGWFVGRRLVSPQQGELVSS